MNHATESPERILGQMLLAPRICQALYVAAKLRIADQLADGSRSCHELGDRTGVNVDALYRVLRCLASYGIFAEETPGTFSLTPLADLLRTDAPASLRAVALWSGSVAYTVFGGLEYTVRTGKPAFDHLFGSDFYSYLADNPEASAMFDSFMARQTQPVASALLEVRDFAQERVVVDVGGGRGELLAAVLASAPGARGILFDRAHVLMDAEKLLEERGLTGRCTLVEGDMEQSVPAGGSIYILKSIVHAFDDEAAVHLLRRCRNAMVDDGRLLVIEYVVPAGNDPHPGKLLDLVTLVGTHGGRQRTQREFEELFHRAGLVLCSVAQTTVHWSVLEAGGVG